MINAQNMSKYAQNVPHIQQNLPRV